MKGRGERKSHRGLLQRNHTETLVKVIMVSTKSHHFQTDAHSENGLNGPSEKTMWSPDSLGLASGPYCLEVGKNLHVITSGQI